MPEEQTPQQSFVHLHVHTEFSLLDGLSKIDKLAKRARALNMPALAITDHGAMHGVIQFHRACMNNGIKPIIGMEGYLARHDMRTHDPSEKQPFHLLLLARNMTGYQNLLKIASTAQLEGFYMRPRIDKDFLAAHAEGLICTSGCLAAEIPRMVLEGRDEEALRTIGWYQDVFGKQNFFLELQHHQIDELFEVNRWLYDNRGFADVPLLATNDVHYILESDYDAHDTLLCIQTGALKSDEKRMRMTDASYHLRSPQEMWNLFDEVPDALNNTLLVAEMCSDLNLEKERYHLPTFPVPEGFTAASYLRFLAERGLRWRYGARAERADIRERLDYELAIISRMGFDTYFLIVWDLCQFARYADIWWNVRGSAAGSVTAYTLGITNIDPLANGLIFERFLNPGRVSMPDIDMDFPDDRRSEMIEYAMRKYGSDKVAAIITFGTLKARAAIKDVGRALDYPLPEVNSLTALVPNIPSRPVTLAECLGYGEGEDRDEKIEPRLKEKYENDPRVRALLDTAMTVEGVARNAGTHAAGVIIGDKPLVEYLPLHRPLGDTKVTQITQFTMEVCESIGLLKVDFLGLSTLTVMRKACELIERYHGDKYTMDNIPYRPDPNDPEQTRRVEKLFELIGNGETTGVFQLESGGMKKMLTEMKPKTFEHIVAAISLYRPGPMDLIPTYIRRMHGKEQVQYHHEKLVPILEETYGICVYQEQIQQIAAQLFGYSLGDADLMRRAVSKKKKKDLEQHKAIFLERGPENGVPVEVAEKIFDEIEYFAAYGFNKSHAADYAVLTCQTAYLKAHYPEEYYTALLSVQRHNIADVALFTSDCRKFGIPILAPDVNASDVDFVIEPLPDGKRGIRYGLSAIKNVGERVVELIIQERSAGGPFSSLPDFARRVNLTLVGKRALEALAMVGAFDTLVDGDRDKALCSVERMLDFSKSYHEAKAKGQISLFGDAESFELSPVPPEKRSNTRKRLGWEKELVGLYVSSHPLHSIMHQVEQLPNFQLVTAFKGGDAEELNGRAVTVVGLVVNKRTMLTKNGDEMGVIVLEDVTGSIQCVLFPRTWRQYREIIVDDSLLIVRGRLDTGRGEVQIIVDTVSGEFTLVRGADEPTPARREQERERDRDRQHAVPTFQALLTEDDLLDAREPDVSDVGDAPRLIDEDDLGDDGFPRRSIFDTAATSAPDTLPEMPAAQPLPSNAAARRAEAEGYGTSVIDTALEGEHPGEQLNVNFDDIDLDSIDAVEEKPVIALPPCLITITFHTTDDVRQDCRRMNYVRNKLNEFPGQDQYQFKVEYPSGRRVLLRFPQRTKFVGEVENFLTSRFDPNDIQVEQIRE